jgi:hypothetical protein
MQPAVIERVGKQWWHNTRRQEERRKSADGRNLRGKVSNKRLLFCHHFPIRPLTLWFKPSLRRGGRYRPTELEGERYRPLILAAISAGRAAVIINAEDE